MYLSDFYFIFIYLFDKRKPDFLYLFRMYFFFFFFIITEIATNIVHAVYKSTLHVHYL